MKKWIDRYAIYAINMVYVLALAIVVIPLLMLGNYNYPSADDWSYGVSTRAAVQNGDSILGVLGAACKVAIINYWQWEGRFSNCFLASLQPGIWGESYYGITVWLMLGGLCISTLVFGCVLLRINLNNKAYVMPIVAPILIMQILFVPYPDESFYWYTGAVNYTFMYALALLLIAGFVSLARVEQKSLKMNILKVVCCGLAIIIGGNNFATSMATFLILALLLLWYAISKRDNVRKLWYIVGLSGAGMCMAIFAPANRVRINANFHGETGNAVQAIIKSVARTATNIYSWTDIKVLIMLCLIAPFMWMVVKGLTGTFCFPGLFTLLSYGVYASMIVATMYVDGSTGGGRMGAILYYAYFVWMVVNCGYWMGWLQKRVASDKIMGLFRSGHLMVWCAVFGAVLLVMCGALKESTTFYKAYRSLKQGWAQEYARVWEERLILLHDENIDVVQVRLLDIYPEMIVYADIQKDENLWVNDACAMYYGKSLVEVVE